MAGYSWGFSAPASPITITDGTNTYTYTGMAIPMGGYSYTVTDFNENDEVAISAVGYNKVTTSVGEVTIIMTEMPEVEVLNPNGTNYAIADAKARQQVADLETSVYNDLQNYVTTDTAQTISGEKTFSSSIRCDGDVLIKASFTKGSTPASNAWQRFTISDSTGEISDSHRLATFEGITFSNGDIRATMRAFQNAADSSANSYISIQKNADGTNETYAPACSNANSIVTTTAINKSANGYVKLGNGIVIQKGVHEVSSSGSSTLTFPTAFSNTNYSLGVCRLSGSSTTNESGSFYLRGRTTTTASIYITTNTRSIMWIAIGY